MVDISGYQFDYVFDWTILKYPQLGAGSRLKVSCTVHWRALQYYTGMQLHTPNLQNIWMHNYVVKSTCFVDRTAMIELANMEVMCLSLIM